MDSYEYLATQYPELTISFYLREKNEEQVIAPSKVWEIHPESVHIVRFESCLICEIVGIPGTEDAIAEFKDYIYAKELLRIGMDLLIEVYGEYQQRFNMVVLDCWIPGNLLCTLRREEILLYNPSANTAVFSGEEETFFSQFRKELDSDG